MLSLDTEDLELLGLGENPWGRVVELYRSPSEKVKAWRAQNTGYSRGRARTATQKACEKRYRQTAKGKARRAEINRRQYLKKKGAP